MRIALHHLRRARNAHLGQQAPCRARQAARRSVPRWTRIGSVTWLPIVSAGLSAAAVSWNTTPMRRPRKARRVAQQVVAVEGETSRLELRRRSEQAEQRQHDGGLARAGLAHQSQRAARRDGERTSSSACSQPARGA